jgi:hypothetical protein
MHGKTGLFVTYDLKALTASSISPIFDLKDSQVSLVREIPFGVGFTSPLLSV